MEYDALDRLHRAHVDVRRALAGFFVAGVEISEFAFLNDGSCRVVFQLPDGDRVIAGEGGRFVGLVQELEDTSGSRLPLSVDLAERGADGEIEDAVVDEGAVGLDGIAGQADPLVEEASDVRSIAAEAVVVQAEPESVVVAPDAGVVDPALRAEAVRAHAGGEELGVLIERGDSTLGVRSEDVGGGGLSAPELGTVLYLEVLGATLVGDVLLHDRELGDRAIESETMAAMRAAGERFRREAEVQGVADVDAVFTRNFAGRVPPRFAEVVR